MIYVEYKVSLYHNLKVLRRPVHKWVHRVIVQCYLTRKTFSISDAPITKFSILITTTLVLQCYFLLTKKKKNLHNYWIEINNLVVCARFTSVSCNLCSWKKFSVYFQAWPEHFVCSPIGSNHSFPLPIYYAKWICFGKLFNTHAYIFTIKTTNINNILF